MTQIFTPQDDDSAVSKGAAVAHSDGDLAWAELVRDNPIPTLLLRCDEPSANNGAEVVFANESAKALLRADDSPAPLSSLLSLIDQPSRTAITHVRSNHERIVEISRPTSPDPIVRTAYLSRHDDGITMAQFVAQKGAEAVNRVVKEQQRFRSALMELSELAYATKDDDEFYQRLIERAVEVVPGAQAGSVQLNIPGTETFRFVAAVGFDLAGLQQHVLDQSDFFRDALDPRAQIVREFAIDARSPEIAEWLNTVGRLSEMVVDVSAPVLVDGLPVAFLALDNFEDPDAMNETSVEMTTVLSRLIGELWRRRDLESKVRKEREAFRHQAMHDPLTGLANRRSLEKALASSSTGSRSDHPRAVLFVDIDDFKGVNDRLGHEVGDLLLIGVANELSDVVRENDLVGRWGGDEFLILPYRVATCDEAMELANRVLQRFEQDLLLGDELSFRTRLTVGVGWSPDGTIDSSVLVRAADQALYEAKAAGKGMARLNRVT